MAEIVRVTLKMERRLKLPTLPNFIRDEDDNAVPVESLTQDQLEEIGRAWTKALQQKARDRASEVTRKLNEKLSA